MSERIDDLLEVLRQPGTPSELVDESRSIEAIASAIATTKENTPMNVRPIRGRKMRVASFIAAGAIGFGTVAAAGPGSFDEAAFESIVEQANSAGAGGAAESTTTTTTTEPPVEAASTPTSAPAPDTPTNETPGTDAPTGTDDELVDDPDTAFDERKCADGNHGQTVSSVARTPGRTSDEVRDAAHSSCGKKDKDGDDGGGDDDTAEGDVQGEDEEGNGKSNGVGHGGTKPAKPDAPGSNDPAPDPDSSEAGDDSGSGNTQGGGGNSNGNGGGNGKGKGHKP